MMLHAGCELKMCVATGLSGCPDMHILLSHACPVAWRMPHLAACNSCPKVCWCHIVQSVQVHPCSTSCQAACASVVHALSLNRRCDFGFSKDTVGQSTCKSSCGTPEYIAPEVRAARRRQMCQMCPTLIRSCQPCTSVSTVHGGGTPSCPWLEKQRKIYPHTDRYESTC